MFVTDWLVCDTATASSWHRALLDSNVGRCDEIAATMPIHAVSQGLTPVDVGLLFAALAGEPVDAAILRANDSFEHISVIDNPKQAAYLVAIAPHVVRALANLGLGDSIDPATIAVWTGLADSYYEVDDSSRGLTPEAALRVVELCRESRDRGLRLFGCVRTPVSTER